jgi:hypothetical protein
MFRSVGRLPVARTIDVEDIGQAWREFRDKMTGKCLEVAERLAGIIGSGPESWSWTTTTGYLFIELVRSGPQMSGSSYVTFYRFWGICFRR